MTRLSAELRVGDKESPKFIENQLHYQIDENSRSDVTIGWLMTDSTRNTKFRLIDSTDFVINSTTGRLKTRHSLDREQKSRHDLKLELIDSTNSKQIDMASVQIDVLDVQVFTQMF